MPVKVIGQRVKRDSPGYKPVDGMGGVTLAYPEDGYVITVQLPGAIPVYVRHSDIEQLNKADDGALVDLTTWEKS